MIEIAVRKHNGRSLIPVDEIAARELSRVPSNVDLLVKVSAPKNMKLLRFLWALADKVAEASEWLHDGDDAMDELKIRARHVKYLVNPTTGEVRIVPKSLAKLDGAALSRLANRMVYVVCRDIVPGLDETALRAEIVSMIAGPEDSNSVETSAPQAQSQPDTLAAAEIPLPAAASNPSQSSVPSPTDEEAQAGDATPAGLPSGWAIAYCGALRRAQKLESLKKYAAQWWSQYGGFDAHKNGPDGPTAIAIYDAFSANFGRPELLESALREII